MDPTLFLVVIAGGSGTRFWPKSTSRRPKQLLPFPKETLLTQTVKRFENLVPVHQRMIVTTQSLQNAIADENLNAQILAEPQGRNTAPCIYWAAREISKTHPQGIMLVMPADHYIASPENFCSVVKNASQWAKTNEDLITLGIHPTRPETGYGYLRTAEPLKQAGNCMSPKKVEAFVEKPNLEKAKQFLQSGNYLWNGGMFIWRAEVILKAFDRWMPEMKATWEKAQGQVELAYPQLTATSIDYGVMEKADNVVTFPLDCGWDDLGNWTSLEGLAPSLGAQQGGNVVTSGDLLSIDSEGNIIDAPEKLIALLGVQNLIIVEHGKALLVAQKERAQDIRKIVDQLKMTHPDLV